MSHLVYITTVKQDYIGQSELAAAPLMDQVVSGNLPVKLEKASLAMNMMDQHGRHALNQRPLISSDWFTANIPINPRHIVDIRAIGKDSPLRNSYNEAWKKASAENSGITLVKSMPQNLPGISNN